MRVALFVTCLADARNPQDGRARITLPDNSTTK